MIKHILDTINKEDYRRLMYAFEHQLEQYVLLSDEKTYIGVNMNPVTLKGYKILEQAGNFCHYGKTE